MAGKEARIVVDVAGVPVGLESSDDVRAGALRDAFHGFPERDVAPRCIVAIDASAGAVPDRPPVTESFGIAFWTEPNGMTLTVGSLVVQAVDGRVDVHAPDLDDLAVLEGILPVAVAWPLVESERYLVHAAAVANEDGALLALGPSGRGKSTLAAAALERGWNVLSDDLVVLDATTAPVTAYGIHSAPAVPMEIGGPIVECGTPVDGPRARSRLDRGVLTAGGFAVRGLIVLAHAPEAAGSLGAARALDTVPLLLASFPAAGDPARRAAFFAFAARLATMPAWELGHANEVALRRGHAGDALAVCWAEVRSARVP